MKTTLALSVLLLACGPALAAKPCEELKGEIAAKLDASKISGYTLAVVAADQVGTAKVVGSCESGSKKIIYTKAPRAAAK